MCVCHRDDLFNIWHSPTRCWNNNMINVVGKTFQFTPQSSNVRVITGDWRNNQQTFLMSGFFGCFVDVVTQWLVFLDIVSGLRHPRCWRVCTGFTFLTTIQWRVRLIFFDGYSDPIPIMTFLCDFIVPCIFIVREDITQDAKLLRVQFLPGLTVQLERVMVSFPHVMVVP